MSIQVELSELADALADYRYAYLITTTDGGRAHVVAVTPTLAGGALTVADLGRRTMANATDRPEVTLVWPPQQPDGYSLIVDGPADVADGVVSVTPSRAVLHRPAPTVEGASADVPGGLTGGPAPGCVSDCVEIDLATS